MIDNLAIEQRCDDKAMPSTSITASLEFSDTGYLRAVYLQCQDDGEQAILEKALARLLQHRHMGWIRRLFRKDWPKG